MEAIALGVEITQA